MLMARSVVRYRWLGRLVAGASRREARASAQQYIHAFMDSLRQPPTRARHANVLMHLMGYLRTALDSADRRELLGLIHAYRMGHVPRIVPLTLLNHHFRRHPHPYVAGQYYLEPPPAELMLRCGA
jgi:uncharacterized protein YbgA (DUF1722 family)